MPPRAGWWCSAANPTKLTDIDVRNVGATLVDQRRHRGERHGLGRDGQPDQRCRMAGQQAPRVRRHPEAGHVILSGSFIKAIPFQAGDNVEALFNGLGEVTFRAR